MSQGTWRCWAEVEFSRIVQVGDARERQRFRARWECRRAHKNATGNPRQPRRSLFRVLDENNLEELANADSAKYYKEPFDRILGGMTLSDFQRSVLLAQGEFEAFLRADASEKASILGPVYLWSQGTNNKQQLTNQPPRCEVKVPPNTKHQRRPVETQSIRPSMATHSLISAFSPTCQCRPPLPVSCLS